MKWWWGSLCSRPAHLDFYSASSLKQRSTGRYIAPLGHIILVPSQPVFALSNAACLVTNTMSIVFGLTQAGLYHTRDEHANHFATDAVRIDEDTCMLTVNVIRSFCFHHWLPMIRLL